VATFGDLVTDALSEINALTPGQPIDAGDMSLGIQRVINFLDSMTARPLMSFVKLLNAYTFGSTKQTYTIGPSGDFVTNRPQEILGADIVDNAVSPTIFIPVRIVDADEYESIRVLNIQSSIPVILWYQPTFPNGTINMWPQPASPSFQLRIQVNSPFGQGAVDVGTTIVTPPGGYEAIMYSVAERLCNPFGKTGPIVQDLQERARKAIALFVSVNAESPKLAMDSQISSASGPVRPYFNWLTGDIA
jgi:hypothetical protein